MGKVTNAKLPGGALSERYVKKGAPVGAHPRPSDIRPVVEERMRPAVHHALGKDLIGRIAIRYEVEGLAVAPELTQQVVGHVHGQTLRPHEIVVVHVVRECVACDEHRAERQPRCPESSPLQHDFPRHFPSLPSTHAPQATLRR